MKIRFCLPVVFFAFFLTQVFAQSESRLLRFPAIHGNQLVFSYAGDLYTVSSKGGVARKLTNDPGCEMFARFSPDENKRFNLYGYEITSRQTRKYTNFADFDIKFPSLGDDALVLQNGGYLYRFDLKSRKSEKKTISIADDQAGGRGGWTDVSKQITNYEISPDGSRALFGAHGEIFTVPAKYGNTRNLTNTSGSHERASKWSPDGKWIAYISDASGGRRAVEPGNRGNPKRDEGGACENSSAASIPCSLTVRVRFRHPAFRAGQRSKTTFTTRPGSANLKGVLSQKSGPLAQLAEQLTLNQ